MISSLMFIWLRFTLPQFASYLSSFQTDPSFQYLNTSKYYNLTDIVPKLLTQKVYYVDIDTGQQLAAPFETQSLTG